MERISLFFITIAIVIAGTVGVYAANDDAESTEETGAEATAKIEEQDDAAEASADEDVAGSAEEAETAPMDDETRAQLASGAFALGNDAYTTGDYLEASTQYRKAYELRPNWKLQYNIGQCEALLKRHGLALLAFERYLSEGGDDMSAERRDEVASEVARLRTLVGYLDVTAEDNAAITIDGIYRGDAPLTGTIPVAVATEHEVSAGTLPGRVVVVHGGQTIAVNFKIRAKDADAVTSTESGGDESTELARTEESSDEIPNSAEAATTTVLSSDKLKPISIALMATGGAALVAGVITGSLALKKNSFLNDHCDLPECDPQFEEDLNQRDNLAIATNVLMGSGIVLGTAGAILFFYAKKKRKQETPNVTAVVGTDLVGVSAHWQF